MENEGDEGKMETIQTPKRYYAVLTLKRELAVIKTNCSKEQSAELQNIFTQRVEKGIMYPEVGTVLSVEFRSDLSGETETYGCFYYSINIEEDKQAEQYKYIVCFIGEQEQTLDLFRTDLDEYCADILKPLKSRNINSEQELPASLVQALERWYTVAVEYLNRCKLALGDNLKFLIFAALHDYKLTVTGGSAELQSDIERFYRACSLSDILRQLRETRQRQEAGSLSGSMDMLIDVHSGLVDTTQDTLTVSISADSLRLDSNGCNKFCEEWANAVCRPEFQDLPIKQKQVIEAFKLKFIQTMNTLKRLLREAENDYYALYRSFVFLRDSGNSEILLHYVTTEGASDTASVLSVLQEFIQEQVTV